MSIALINNLGRGIMLYRAYTANANLSSTLRLAPAQFQAGINQTTTPELTTTSIDNPIPLDDGTVNDDGSNQLTGSNGGTDTTDNTTTYKEGAGQVDATSQNLIAGSSSATKTWTISNLASNGTNISGTQPFGFWLYIKDTTTYDKFLTSGTCLEVRFGSDASNYYSKTFTASDLAVGWNWITSNTTNVEDLTETGTVSGNIDTFVIQITTNNSSDTFSAGDVMYDLLRQWATSDLYVDFASGYPSFDYVNNEVTIRVFLDSTKANGFDINAILTANKDTTPLADFIMTMVEESKSSTDEFAWVLKHRILSP